MTTESRMREALEELLAAAECAHDEYRYVRLVGTHNKEPSEIERKLCAQINSAREALSPPMTTHGPNDPGDEQPAPWLDEVMRPAKAEIESTPEQLRREPGDTKANAEPFAQQPKPVEGWLARTLERVTEAANRAPEWATSRQPGESACSASPFASVPAGPFLGQTRLVEARREFNYTNCVRNAVRLTISEAQSPPTRRTSAAEAEVERLRGLLKEAEDAIRLAMEWGLFVYHGPEEYRDDPDVEPCNDDCKACAFERHPAVRRALGEIGG